MENSIIKELEKLVENTCKKETNYFGYEIWTFHIKNVVKYAKLLARKLKADEEIVEIAALLHDYAGIKDYKLREEHHIHGAEEAEKILGQFNYPASKIEQVKHCILSHRGSKKIIRQSIEATCVADADAMAHINAIPALLYFAFKGHKMNIEEATAWLTNKLERSWNKLSPHGKEMIKLKYDAYQVLIKNELSISKSENHFVLSV